VLPAFVFEIHGLGIDNSLNLAIALSKVEQYHAQIPNALDEG
jgi:hypothetical protein